VTQRGSGAHLALAGDGDLDAAAEQTCRFLSLDVDAGAWPAVAERDPVLADAQARLPGLRAVEPDQALRSVQQIKGLGPFAAELVVIRGANAPDVLPQHEGRLADEVSQRYGADYDLADISQAWRPFRGWAAVHLRVLREMRNRPHRLIRNRDPTASS